MLDDYGFEIYEEPTVLPAEDEVHEPRKETFFPANVGRDVVARSRLTCADFAADALNDLLGRDRLLLYGISTLSYLLLPRHCRRD